MGRTKIIANYLPQFHRIPENDLWWGCGYTDWTAVKKSIPLYEGHHQPNIPLNKNYYDLSDEKNIEWQAKLAKKYGIDGFGIYHYWFSSDLNLLDKPAVLLRDNKDIDINYMFIWDNASWKRTWSNVKKNANDWAPISDELQEEKQGDGILAKLRYGDEDDWEKHFQYLLTFFNDKRYIKINNRPVFGFFNQFNDDRTIKEMVKYWDGLAKDNGFDGVFIIGKHEINQDSWIKNEFYYEPYQHVFGQESIFKKVIRKIHRDLFKIDRLCFYDYDKSWESIISDAKIGKENIYYTGIVNYDDTPRRGKKGKILKNASPIKFEKHIKELYQISCSQKKELMFVIAWNEWGEGAYLEPDEENGYAYLEALKRAVDSVKE